MLTVKELNTAERAVYYSEKLVRDFPPDEVKPLEMIEQLCRKGDYHWYAFLEGETPVGYACLMQKFPFVLLDYLAMEPEQRGKGFGGQALSMIAKQLLPQGETLLIEAENPAVARDLADREIRLRRVQFYRQNGMLLREALGQAFGVEYRLFTAGVDCSEQQVVDGYRSLYAAMLPETLFRAHVWVWIP